jgi:acyl carrier protein
MTDRPTDATILEAVAVALGLEDDEITSDATLLGDLGAESIDLLDILFRIERATGVRVEAGDLAEHIQGGIPDEEFGDDAGLVSAVGLAHLKTVMPQIDVAALTGSLEAEQVITLFTVANLADMVAQRAAVVG